MASTPAGREEGDIRPVVARGGQRSLAPWLFAGGIAVIGIVIFSSLDSRRRAIEAPATTIPAADSSSVLAAPPPLDIPGGPGPDMRFRVIPVNVVPVSGSPQAAGIPPRAPAPVRSAQAAAPAREPQGDQAAPRFTPPVVSGRTIFEPQTIPAASAVPVSGSREGAGVQDRVSAGFLANPGTTVPQGTVIQAVLETAIDSTRPGGVRAIVSRDVRGFDGARILVPRGSRLYGEASAELGAGQNRALIRWMRLTRPDGAIIALDSPASDPLGRAGVKGKVDSHFLQRFGGAILQSVLDIGVGVATRKAAGDGVIVALPGSTQNITRQDAAQVQRTLTVRQGASVSVFVARDLDFAPVER